MTVPTTPIDLSTLGPKDTDSKPAVIATKTGFFVAWSRSDVSDAGVTTYSVMGQNFNLAGKPVGRAFTIAERQGLDGPSVADLGGGDVAVVWGDDRNVKGSVIDTAKGTAGKIVDLGLNTGSQEHELASLGNGKLALVTHEIKSAGGFDVNVAEKLQILSGSLKPVGALQPVYDYTYSAFNLTLFFENEEAIVANGKGGVVFYRDHTSFQFEGRAFDAAGKLGKVFALNTTHMEELTAFDGVSFRIETAELAKGGYVAAWSSRENHDNALDFDIRARVFTESGKPLGKDILINVDRDGGQFQPDVVALKDGGFAVGWSSGGALGAPEIDHVIRYFDAKGAAVSDEISTQKYSFLGPDAMTNGGYMNGDVSYATLSDGSIVKAFGNIFPGEPLQGDGVLKATIGTAKADNLKGLNKADDLLLGGAGDDKAHGNGGDDFVNGYTGADKLYGDAGNDTLTGGADNDTLYGGNNHDLLVGGAGRDALYGQSGNDTLIGGESADNLYGGAGVDTFVFDKVSGLDKIYDWKVGEDVLDLRAFDFDSVADVKSHAELVGKNVVLHLDEGVDVTLIKTTMADIAQMTDRDVLL